MAQRARLAPRDVLLFLETQHRRAALALAAARRGRWRRIIIALSLRRCWSFARPFGSLRRRPGNILMRQWFSLWRRGLSGIIQGRPPGRLGCRRISLARRLAVRRKLALMCCRDIAPGH